MNDLPTIHHFDIYSNAIKEEEEDDFDDLNANKETTLKLLKNESDQLSTYIKVTGNESLNQAQSIDLVSNSDEFYSMKS